MKNIKEFDNLDFNTLYVQMGKYASPSNWNGLYYYLKNNADNLTHREKAFLLARALLLEQYGKDIGMPKDRELHELRKEESINQVIRKLLDRRADWQFAVFGFEFTRHEKIQALTRLRKVLHKKQAKILDVLLFKVASEINVTLTFEPFECPELRRNF